MFVEIAQLNPVLKTTMILHGIDTDNLNESIALGYILSDTASLWSFSTDKGGIIFLDVLPEFGNLYHGRKKVAQGSQYNHAINLILNKENLMARKKKENTVTQESHQSVKPVWGGYVNISLSSEQKEELSESIHTDNALVLETLAEMLLGGKITVNLDDSDMVSVTYTREHGGKLWALSAFASTFLVALQVLDYKTYAYPTWFLDGKPQVDKGLFG